MKKKIKLKGQLKTYIQWPLILSILLLVMNISMYPVSVKAGLLMSAFLVIYVVVVTILYVRNRSRIYTELLSFATQYDQIQRKLLRELAIPYGLLDEDGKVLWANTAFFEVSGKSKKSLHKPITHFFPEFAKEMLPQEDSEENKTIRFSYEEKDFRVNVQKVYMDHMIDASAFLEDKENDEYFLAVYLFEETEINKYIRMVQEERLVAGLIYLDNYASCSGIS